MGDAPRPSLDLDPLCTWYVPGGGGGGGTDSLSVGSDCETSRPPILGI